MEFKHIIQKSLLAMMAAAALVSCDMMTEDLSDCPAGLYVNFVYDYNIQRADMFKDHVGAIQLYVYDESDALVAQRTIVGDPLSKYGFCCHFTEQELAPNHQYRLRALAMQKDMATSATHQLPQLAIGSSLSDIQVALRINGLQPAVQPLDTLWYSLTTLQAAEVNQPAATKYHQLRDGSIETNGLERVSLVKGEPTYATVSLIRDTKHLNISLRELDHPELLNHEDYEVFILDRNTALDFKNDVMANADSVIYRPYAQWTTTFNANGTAADERSAHYDLTFNRLIYNAEKVDSNALLCIRKKTDGTMVAAVNLPYILSEGRTAYEIYSYQPQEYLDREYDYRLEFFLKGDRWQYVSVCIDVLSWAKRIQIEEL